MFIDFINIFYNNVRFNQSGESTLPVFFFHDSTWINYWKILGDCYFVAPIESCLPVFRVRVDRPFPHWLLTWSRFLLCPAEHEKAWCKQRFDKRFYTGACYCAVLLGALCHLERRSGYTTDSLIRPKRDT